MPSRLARPIALALLFGLVLLFGAGGTTWAHEEREYQTFHHKPGGTVPPREADIAIDKSGTWTGENIKFTITVSNGGPIAASNVTVVDGIPGSLSISSYSTTKGNCSNRGNTLTCRIGQLNAGQEARIEVKTRVKSRFTRQVINIAVAASSTRDPSYRNNIDSAKVTRR